MRLKECGLTTLETRRLGTDTKSRWSRLSGVKPGEVKDPTQGVNV